MKRLRWLVISLCVVSAHSTFANTISNFKITQETVFIGTYSDNVYFSLTGPHANISGTGGIQCQMDWCGGQMFAPGSTTNLGFWFDGRIFLDGGVRVRLGQHDFGETDTFRAFLALQSGYGVRFPTDFKSFTTCGAAAMPASMSGSVGAGDNFMQFVLQGPSSGTFCTTWEFIPGPDGGYTFAGGKFVANSPVAPEPSTLGLVGSGLLGLAAVVRKRRRSSLHAVSPSYSGRT